jgi:hypothetical protein
VHEKGMKQKKAWEEEEEKNSKSINYKIYKHEDTRI